MNKKDTVNIGSRGYYSLSVFDKDGVLIEDKTIDNVNNVITYEGAYRSLIGDGGNSPLFSSLYAAVGTSSVERTRSSTGLGVEDPGRSSAASASRGGNEVDNLNGTSTLTLVRTLPFSLGAKVGTFSEVGVFNSASGGEFIAGQLIKDELGDPTTITLLADEQLVVTYTLEWTVPTVSTLVGSGTVQDADLNNYNYEVWAQPYFNEYTVGSTTTGYSYFSATNAGVMYIRDGLGTGNFGFSIDSGTGWAGRYSHDGSGTVTATTQPYTYSPTQFSATDMVFFCFYTYAPTFGDIDIVDTATALAGESTQTNISPGLVVKFINPITKTTNDSFALQASVTLVI